MDLFNQITILETDISQISGLKYIEGYISKQEHDILLSIIDLQPWIHDLKRRVQHYGYKYDYKARRIDLKMRIGELPDWANLIGERLFKDGYFKELPDQLIINEYLPGQGITAHIDCEPCFEDTVVSISLGSNCTMDFCNKLTSEKQSLMLAQRSIVVLQGESRYNWTHGIAARKNDKYNGQIYQRKRRVSLTFRKTIIQL
jgi:alkylated DNA repair dioxygenase AlkB